MQRPWGEWAGGVCGTARSPVWLQLVEQAGDTISFSSELHAASVPDYAYRLSITPPPHHRVNEGSENLGPEVGQDTFAGTRGGEERQRGGETLAIKSGRLSDFLDGRREGVGECLSLQG